MNSIEDVTKILDLAQTPNLKAYIEQLRIETKGLSDIEKLRYIYLDFGKKVKFDPYYAATDSRYYMNTTYRDSQTPEHVEKGVKHGYMICKTACYILQVAISELTKFNIKTVVHPYFNFSNLPHVINLIPISDEEFISLDLVNDTKYIQSGMRTSHFGRIFRIDKRNGQLDRTDDMFFSRDRLAEIDRKCGYISDKKVYSDEYYYDLMRYYTEMIPGFKEKLHLFFTNSDQPDISQKMGEIEAIWLHERVLKSLFPERNNQGEIMYDNLGEVKLDKRISAIAGVERLGGKKGERHFQMYVVAENERDPYETRDIYFYDDTAHKYRQISLEEFYKMCHSKKYRMSDSFLKDLLLNAYKEREQK